MMTFKTSATALLALGLIAGASTAASACEWQKQVMAPAPEKTTEQASSPATTFDPMVLARTQSPEPESRTVEQ